MRNLRRKIIILFGSATLLLGNLCLAHGQLRTVRVYRPGTYNRTRTVMSNRAALRKALKRKAAKKRHRARRR